MANSYLLLQWNTEYSEIKGNKLQLYEPEQHMGSRKGKQINMYGKHNRLHITLFPLENIHKKGKN